MSKMRIFVLVVVIGLVAGCTFAIPGGPAMIAGSGKTVTVEENLTGFSKVAVGSAFQVDISQAEAYSVVVTVDQNAEPYLDVAVQGDQLRIYLKPGVSFTGGMHTLRATVTMPELTGLNLSGASRAGVTGFKSDKQLAVEASGASSLEGDIEAGDTGFNLSGASRATLRGAGRNMNLEASGASRAELAEFAVTDASVELSGASRATVNVTGKLNADVSGASQLRYTGNPTMGTVKSSGASTIQPQ